MNVCYYIENHKLINQRNVSRLTKWIYLLQLDSSNEQHTYIYIPSKNHASFIDFNGFIGLDAFKDPLNNLFHVQFTRNNEQEETKIYVSRVLKS